MKRHLLDELLEARAEKVPCAVITYLSSGRQILYRQNDHADAGAIAPELHSEIRDALRQDRSRCVETETESVFVHVFNPPLRLVVVGAVHIAQALVPMAELVGYEVVVVDPRRSFASGDRFPGTALVDEWPDDAVAALVLDSRTALVTLTHDPKLDDPALIAGLRSPAFYIGSLGSRRTHRTRLERLRQAGVEERALARIHAPIGLDIGAQSPAEIAAAIVAEITAVLRGEEK